MTNDANNLRSSVPLFTFARGDFPEVVVHGVSIFNDQPGRYRRDFADVPLVGRSLLKPWQLLATGIVDDDPAKAVCMASHSGQDTHLAALRAIMRAEGVAEAEFQCPASLPMDREIAAAMRHQRAAKSRLYHPCSGKHLAFIAACHRHGLDAATYLQSSHPLQQKLRDTLLAFGAEILGCVADSCGLPSFVLPVHAHLQIWRTLATTDAADVAQLRKLWLQYPEMVGGKGRLDSEIVHAGGGLVLAKEGADGLLVVQTLEPTPQSALIKIASGYSPAFLGLALYQLLHVHQTQLGSAMLAVQQYLGSKLSEWVPRDQRLVEPSF